MATSFTSFTRFIISLLVLLCIFIAATFSATPSSQLVLPARIVEVYDGDTVTVEFKLRARVRLLDCWAPELNQPGGNESRAALKQYEQQTALVVIPLDRASRLDDIFSFGRLLGDVVVDGKSLAEQQVATGNAKRQK